MEHYSEEKIADRIRQKLNTAQPGHNPPKEPEDKDYFVEPIDCDEVFIWFSILGRWFKIHDREDAIT